MERFVRRYSMGTQGTYLTHWRMTTNAMAGEEEEERNNVIRLRFVARMQ